MGVDDLVGFCVVGWGSGAGSEARCLRPCGYPRTVCHGGGCVEAAPSLAENVSARRSSRRDRGDEDCQEGELEKCVRDGCWPRWRGSERVSRAESRLVRGGRTFSGRTGRFAKKLGLLRSPAGPERRKEQKVVARCRATPILLAGLIRALMIFLLAYISTAPRPLPTRLTFMACSALAF